MFSVISEMDRQNLLARYVELHWKTPKGVSEQDEMLAILDSLDVSHDVALDSAEVFSSL